MTTDSKNHEEDFSGKHFNSNDPVKTFTDFNLAQSTVRIIHNIGFAVAHPPALEIMSRLLERYLGDLCKRIVLIKEQRKCVSFVLVSSLFRRER